MAVGNQPNVGGLNAQLGDYAVALRNACMDISNLWTYISSLGADQAAQEAALVALGFSSNDASTFWVKANNLFAVSQIYYGQINQPAAFNYDSALAGVRGGQ